MNVSTISNISFAKQQIATCKVRTTSKRNAGAKLYTYDPKNEKDTEEISTSPCTVSIKKDFIQEGKNNGTSSKKFFVLSDSSNGEVISCAEINKQGKKIIIEETGSNKNYRNPIAPVITGIVYLAKKYSCEKIISAFKIDAREEDLADSSFCRRIQDNTWIMHPKRYDINIKKAKAKNEFKFIG